MNIFILYYTMENININKKQYIIKKKERREKKNTKKRNSNPEEVIFILEKILEGWKTIRIYNTIIQNNPNSLIDKKKTETIATGNCKIYPNELPTERYDYYLILRENVYNYYKNKL
jgi:hypothetical protein